MNELVLKEMNQDRIVYLYQPEGKGECGEVVYLFSQKRATVEKRPCDDEFGRYAEKACLAVEKRVEKGTLPLKFIQAWY
jgi:hypothetical protein